MEQGESTIRERGLDAAEVPVGRWRTSVAIMIASNDYNIEVRLKLSPHRDPLKC